MLEISSAATVSRRHFLQSTSAALLVGSALGLAGETVLAANPPKRHGPPHLKLSLAAYSFRDELTRGWPKPVGKPGKMTLADLIDYCADQDLDGVELTSYYFPNPLTPDYLMQIKEQTFRLGLEVSGTAIGNNFCLSPGPARDEQLQLCRQWIDFASLMGAPVIRIFAGTVQKGQKPEEALDLCVQGIDESLKYAAEKGVALALENHGGITATPEQLLAIVNRVQSSPWFGINFDSGNFHTEDPYADLEKIAPYAINAQIKASMKRAGQADEPADYARIIQVLRKAGYRGYVALEFEEKEDPHQAIPGHLKKLRELIG